MALEPGRRQVLSIDIAADSETVWANLREPTKIRRWYGWCSDGVDDEIRHLFLDDACVAETDLPGRSGPVRSLTWKGGDLVTVSPFATAPRTRCHLMIARRARERFDGVESLHDAVDERWIASAQQLRFGLEQHPGAERRTLCKAGLDAGPTNNRLLDRVGLHGMRGVPIGALFETRRPDGSLLGGTIWHRTQHQVGIHLYGPTEPLLIIDRVPSTGRRSRGHVNALLSVFGADDEMLAVLEEHWNRWWASRTPALAADSGWRVGTRYP